jgi:hypothetical protein
VWWLSNVSSQFLNLVPVVEQEAADAGLKAAYVVSQADRDTGVFASDWVLVSGNEQFLSNPKVAQATVASPAAPGLRLWTDDYNTVLPLLKWGRSW